MRKNRIVVLMILVVFVILLCTSCATRAIQVPYGASQQEIEQINAENIYATAKNISDLTDMMMFLSSLGIGIGVFTALITLSNYF